MAKKPRNRVVDYSTYLAVRVLVAVVQMVSPRIAYFVADFLAFLAYKLVKGRRIVALENIQAAFPELAANPAKADKLVRDMYKHLFRIVVEMCLLPRKLHVGNWRKHLVLPEGTQAMPPLLDGRPALMVTAHFGSWEMAGYALGLFGFRTCAIARLLDNPHLDRFLLQFRQGTGQTIIEKKDYARIKATLKLGGKIAVLGDQDAGQKGAFVDFFGRPASTHKALALMAIEFDAVMVVFGVPRVRRDDYPQRSDYDPSGPLAPLFYAVRCVDVIDPREYANDLNAVNAITARYTSALEKLIREYPEQYFWLHRRWKNQPAAKKGKKPSPDAPQAA